MPMLLKMWFVYPLIKRYADKFFLLFFAIYIFIPCEPYITTNHNKSELSTALSSRTAATEQYKKIIRCKSKKKEDVVSKNQNYNETMIKRTKFTDDVLHDVRNNIDAIKDAVTDVLAGDTINNAARRRNLYIKDFRNILEEIYSIRTNDEATCETRKMKKDQLYGTKNPMYKRKEILDNIPIENLYRKIFEQEPGSEYKWDTSKLSDDALKAYEYVSRQLTDEEQIIIQKYYFEKKSFREIGRELGVSHSKIMRERNVAISKLRDASCSEILTSGLRNSEFPNTQEEIVMKKTVIRETSRNPKKTKTQNRTKAVHGQGKNDMQETILATCQALTDIGQSLKEILAASTQP